MIFRRGDVVLRVYQYSSDQGEKRRPLLVIQADRDNARMSSTKAAQITSNLSRSGEPTHLRINANTPLWQMSGLLHDSVASCNNLSTITEDRIQKVIGHLDPATMLKIDACLKAALDLS